MILIAGLATIGISLWIRTLLHPGPTALEKLIAENAPGENVHTLAAGPEGALLVGTDMGAIAGQGKHWERLTAVQGNVQALAPTGATFLLAGNGLGVAEFDGVKLKPLRPGDVQALAVHPKDWSHLYAYGTSDGLVESRDGGAAWTRVADFAGEQILALAVNADGQIAAGGLQGALYLSADSGKSWEAQPAPGGTITSLVFDGARLYMLAGGAPYYRDGDNWQRLKRADKDDRLLVALALEPGNKGRLFGATADGYVTELPR